MAELRREPYLSRYLGGRLQAAACGGRILAALRRIERDQIAAGAGSAAKPVAGIDKNALVTSHGWSPR